jgi:pimeloyl-ACP methyl ester carboxylesterase
VHGVSYGTNLALQLLRDHPEGIRAMVLDGVVPPQTRSVEVWTGRPRPQDTEHCSIPVPSSRNATVLFRARKPNSQI